MARKVCPRGSWFVVSPKRRWTCHRSLAAARRELNEMRAKYPGKLVKLVQVGPQMSRVLAGLGLRGDCGCG